MDTRPLCRHFAKTGNCAYGTRCKFQHKRKNYYTQANAGKNASRTAEEAVAREEAIKKQHATMQKNIEINNRIIRKGTEDICWNFKINGYCQSSRCKYSHEETTVFKLIGEGKRDFRVDDRYEYPAMIIKYKSQQLAKKSCFPNQAFESMLYCGSG